MTYSFPPLLYQYPHSGPGNGRIPFQTTEFFIFLLLSLPIVLFWLSVHQEYMAVQEAECPTQGFPSCSVSRALRRDAMARSATLPGRLGCWLCPGGGHKEGPPYLVHLCGSVSGMAPDWLGFGECRRVRGQSADSWNHWLGRMPLPQMGFSHHPILSPMGQAYGISWVEDRGPVVAVIEYSVYLLCFLSLALVFLCRYTLR